MEQAHEVAHSEILAMGESIHGWVQSLGHLDGLWLKYGYCFLTIHATLRTL